MATDDSRPMTADEETQARATAEAFAWMETLCARTDHEVAETLSVMAVQAPEFDAARVLLEHAAMRLRRANGGSVDDRELCRYTPGTDNALGAIAPTAGELTCDRCGATWNASNACECSGVTP